MFFIWTMACGLAPSWDAFLIFRLLVGVFASGPVAIVTGIVADIYNGHRARGRAMAAFMAVSILLDQSVLLILFDKFSQLTRQ